MLTMTEKVHPLASAQEIGVIHTENNQTHLLRLAISEFAQHLRDAGHTESAHFMDIAALALEDRQYH